MTSGITHSRVYEGTAVGIDIAAESPSCVSLRTDCVLDRTCSPTLSNASVAPYPSPRLCGGDV